MIRKIIEKLNLKKMKYVAVILAAVVVFTTTYALILPAITVESGEAADEVGIYLENDSADGTAEDAYEEAPDEAAVTPAIISISTSYLSASSRTGEAIPYIPASPEQTTAVVSPPAA